MGKKRVRYSGSGDVFEVEGLSIPKGETVEVDDEIVDRHKDKFRVVGDATPHTAEQKEVGK